MTWKRLFSIAILALLLCAQGMGCLAPQGSSTLPEATESIHVMLNGMPGYEKKLQMALRAFGEQFPGVEVQVEYLARDPLDDGQSAMDRFKVALMAGKGPDLLLWMPDELGDIDKVVSSNLFADLQPYVEADGFDLSAYHPHMMQAGVHGDKTHYFPLYFQTAYLVTTDANLASVGLGGKTRLRLEEMQQAFSQASEQDSYYHRIMASVSGLFRVQELDGFFPWCGIDLVDYENQAAAAQEDALRQLLDTYSMFRANEQTMPMRGPDGTYAYSDNLNDPADDIMTMLRGVDAGDTLFYFSASNNDYFRNLAFAPQRIAIPFPTEQGAAAGRATIAAGIRAGAENPRNAWELLKILLGADMQQLSRGEADLVPVHLASLEARVATAARSYDTFHFKTHERIPAVSDAQVQAYLESLLEARPIGASPSLVQQILAPTMQPYLDGASSFDSCFETLQNRLTLYAGE